MQQTSAPIDKDAPRPSAVSDSVLGNRLIAGAVLAGCVAVLGLAAFLTPEGGLREAFGYPACGFKTVTSLPCVTCGMTTAFTFAMNGHLLEAFHVQPAGALLALLTMMTTIIAAVAVCTGMSLAPLAKAVFRPRNFVILAIALAGSWGYTIAHAFGVIG